MPIGDWTDESTLDCDSDTVVPTECEAPDEVQFGPSLLTYGEDNCPDTLLGSEYPSIPWQQSDERIELRSGSTVKPIKLPLLQVRTGTTSNSLHGQANADGVVFNWKPEPVCYNRRVIHNPGGDFELIYDQNSNIFDEACIGTLADAEYIAGAVSYEDCAGNTKLKLVFFDKTELVPES